MKRVHLGLLFRRLGSAGIDLALEVSGGVLGSYFGAMIAALVMAIKNENPNEMQKTILNGFGFGFVFCTLSISFINRVLIQGLSRSSIGKKFFELELISTGEPLSWNTMMKRWVLSIVSLVTGGFGYAVMFFNPEGRAFHDFIAMTDVVPLLQSQSYAVEHQDMVHFEPKLQNESTLAHQLNLKIFMLSHHQEERPVANLIYLPKEIEKSESIESKSLAEVIPFHPKKKVPDQEKAELKKAA